jgi:hypothetical protein
MASTASGARAAATPGTTQVGNGAKRPDEKIVSKIEPVVTNGPAPDTSGARKQELPLSGIVTGEGPASPSLLHSPPDPGIPANLQNVVDGNASRIAIADPPGIRENAITLSEALTRLHLGPTLPERLAGIALAQSVNIAPGAPGVNVGAGNHPHHFHHHHRRHHRHRRHHPHHPVAPVTFTPPTR